MAASEERPAGANSNTPNSSGNNTFNNSSSSSSSVDREQPTELLPVPSRNPLPLSPSQEAQVRELYYARVRAHCADQIQAFALCVTGRTFSAPFACRQQKKQMNSCMNAHATPAEMDAAREEWFGRRMERQRERQRKTRRAAEQEAFIREYWRLPEREPEKLLRELERAKQPERVAGVAPGRRAAERNGGSGGVTSGGKGQAEIMGDGNAAAASTAAAAVASDKDGKT